MNIIETTVAALTAEQTNLNTQLAELDAKHKAERDVILVHLTPLVKAIAALTGKFVASTSGTTRKPMSEEGKANIRKALEARKERLAALGAGTPTTNVAAPSAGSEEESKAKKAAKHGK